MAPPGPEPMTMTSASCIGLLNHVEQDQRVEEAHEVAQSSPARIAPGGQRRRAVASTNERAEGEQAGERAEAEAHHGGGGGEDEVNEARRALRRAECGARGAERRRTLFVDRVADRAQLPLDEPL